MKKILEEKEIAEELKTIRKKQLYEKGETPYRNLTDREFEILTYYLFEANKVKNDNIYDSITLMSGVGERGRDCVLYKNDTVSGIVQCKHSKNDSPMNKPSCAQEIIKFILNCIQDPSLIEDINNITYYLVHSKGFNEPAKQFLSKFNKEVLQDKIKLREWTEKVINRYKKLEMTYDEIEKKLIDYLTYIKVKKVENKDLDRMLEKSKDVMQIFFEVRKVIDILPELPRTYEDKELEKECIDKYLVKKFALELNKIKVDRVEKIEAITDYWRTGETIAIISEQDFFDIEILEKYENELITKYKLRYRNCCEDIDEEYDEKKIRKKSRKFYREIMDQLPLPLLYINNNRSFFQRGSYHDLVNGGEIETWKLEPYEEGEE